MPQVKKKGIRTVINVFWTGGWDSTFRILQLSLRNVVVQPYYLKTYKKGEEFELEAIRSITDDIRNQASTRCLLRDAITISISDLEEDQDITQAYHNLNKTYIRHTDGRRLGIQYDWMARFSKDMDFLETGLEKGSNPHVAIETWGAFERIQDDLKGEFYKVNHSVSSKDLIAVFGRYHFPLLDYSKVDMKKEAEEMGLLDIMNKTWFCHTPIDDKPCGQCNPCAQTIESGFAARFSDAALRRFRKRKRIESFRKTTVYKGLRKMWRILSQAGHKKETA